MSAAGIIAVGRLAQGAPRDFSVSRGHPTEGLGRGADIGKVRMGLSDLCIACQGCLAGNGRSREVMSPVDGDVVEASGEVVELVNGMCRRCMGLAGGCRGLGR